MYFQDTRRDVTFYCRNYRKLSRHSSARLRLVIIVVIIVLIISTRQFHSLLQFEKSDAGLFHSSLYFQRLNPGMCLS